jgi:hypothetical protein
MKYDELAKVNVNEHIEKKNNLSYLSWAWALDYMIRMDENAEWEYREWDGKPYLTLPDGTCMVYCTVTFGGRKRTAHLPVMDHRNKAIQNPDAFQINTTMQRAFVKAIALHGLGLYIYAGEDLPKDEKPEATKDTVNALAKAKVTPIAGSLDALSPDDQKKAKAIANSVVDLWNEGKEFAAYEQVYQAGYDNDFILGLWEVLGPFPTIRNTLKKMHKESQLAQTA